MQGQDSLKGKADVPYAPNIPLAKSCRAGDGSEIAFCGVGAKLTLP